MKNHLSTHKPYGHEITIAVFLLVTQSAAAKQLSLFFQKALDILNIYVCEETLLHFVNRTCTLEAFLRVMGIFYLVYKNMLRTK